MSDPVRPDLDHLHMLALVAGEQREFWIESALELIPYVRSLEAQLATVTGLAEHHRVAAEGNYAANQANKQNASDLWKRVQVLEAQLATARHSERERCAAHVDAYADALLRNGGHGLGTQISYVAQSIRALPDREEPDA